MKEKPNYEELEKRAGSIRRWQQRRQARRTGRERRSETANARQAE